MAQPHKGPRRQVASTRVHEEVYQRMEVEARRLGVAKSDFIAHALCRYFALEEFDPLREQSDEAQMQLTA